MSTILATPHTPMPVCHLALQYAQDHYPVDKVVVLNVVYRVDDKGYVHSVYAVTASYEDQSIAFFTIHEDEDSIRHSYNVVDSYRTVEVR